MSNIGRSFYIAFNTLKISFSSYYEQESFFYVFLETNVLDLPVFVRGRQNCGKCWIQIRGVIFLSAKEFPKVLGCFWNKCGNVLICL